MKIKISSRLNNRDGSGMSSQFVHPAPPQVEHHSDLGPLAGKRRSAAGADSGDCSCHWGELSRLPIAEQLSRFRPTTSSHCSARQTLRKPPQRDFWYDRRSPHFISLPALQPVASAHSHNNRMSMATMTETIHRMARRTVSVAHVRVSTNGRPPNPRMRHLNQSTNALHS